MNADDDVAYLGDGNLEREHEHVKRSNDIM